MYVRILGEVRSSQVFPSSKNCRWDLCFQKCKYVYDDDSFDYGYRFIYRDRQGSDKLLPQRGQARIPSLDVMNALSAVAKTISGWEDFS